MIALVALDFILRRLGAGAMRVAFVIEVACMDPDDRAADVTSFRVPPDAITDFEPLSYLHFGVFHLMGIARVEPAKLNPAARTYGASLVYPALNKTAI